MDNVKNRLSFVDGKFQDTTINETNRDKIIPLLKISSFQFDAILAVLDIGIQAIEPIRELHSQIYSWPLYEQKLYAIDIILDTHGLEYIYEDAWNEYIGPSDPMEFEEVLLVYCNNGDSHRPTVCYEARTGRFFVEGWGDWYERNMQPRSMICPRCGVSDTDTTTIEDHGMCYHCHKMWQWGELPEQNKLDLS